MGDGDTRAQTWKSPGCTPESGGSWFQLRSKDCYTFGSFVKQLSCQLIGSWKQARVRIFLPWKLTNAANQGFYASTPEKASITHAPAIPLRTPRGMQATSQERKGCGWGGRGGTHFSKEGIKINNTSNAQCVQSITKFFRRMKKCLPSGNPMTFTIVTDCQGEKNIGSSLQIVCRKSNSKILLFIIKFI